MLADKCELKCEDARKDATCDQSKIENRASDKLLRGRAVYRVAV